MNEQLVREKAAEFLKTYNPMELVPFPFDEAAIQLGDVDIRFVENSDDAVSGAIYYERDRLKIVINARRPRVRQYFTLAHEFGHYMLHRDWLEQHRDDGFVDFVDYLDSGSRLFRHDIPLLTDEAAIIREREANNFAAELLMPEKRVLELWDVSPDIERNAEVFQVSKSAMAIRLERLGLIS
jgi:Zn-dependent peptidase ImmA (M78 family)